MVLVAGGIAVIAGSYFVWGWLSGTSGAGEEDRAAVRDAPAAIPSPAASGGEVTIELPRDEVIGAPTASMPATPPTPARSTPTAAPAAQAIAPASTGAPATPAQGVIGAPETSAAPTAPSPGGTLVKLEEAIALGDRDPVAARAQLTRLLEGSALSSADRLRGYDAINRINGVLVFSNRIVNGDPYSSGYKVEAGDSLARIAKGQKLECDWRLVQRINGISNPNGLRVGQSVKLPRGVFSAEVRKGEYRLNMYLGDGPDRVMIASYPIGLGELNTTPTGTFSVRPRSKLIDPEWRNPRTGEFFQSNDPKNPIGERWIGLKGIEPHNKGFEGYGIHGTIDPESIGQQRSMGCVRMRGNDVELVYEMLTEPNSTITIAP
jgi:lipoprotein-anchoring transpeptidase ErfK/SrfK